MRTKKLNFYLLKFMFRIFLFTVVFVVYLHDCDNLEMLMHQSIGYGINVVHVIWFVFMSIMIWHLLPNKHLSMAWRKSKEEVYVPVDNYDELDYFYNLRRPETSDSNLLALYMWKDCYPSWYYKYKNGLIWIYDWRS